MFPIVTNGSKKAGVRRNDETATALGGWRGANDRARRGALGWARARRHRPAPAEARRQGPARAGPRPTGQAPAGMVLRAAAWRQAPASR